MPYRHAVRETLTAITIAFALAFVFRGFVIEAFLIPTGSMAPTLRGAHVQITSPQTGYTWAVAPRDMRADGTTPLPVQAPRFAVGEDGDESANFPPLEVHDPMSAWPVQRQNVPTRWGDRIFVFKYLYSIFDPARFDVVVFKNPRDPTVNYIKRLLGLPGEMVAIIDGDVFVRTPGPNDRGEANPWKLPGWRIARKPEQAQRAMWQRIFSSEFQPISPATGLVRWFIPPWLPVGTGPEGTDWILEGRADYEYRGAGPTKLVWDARRRPIDDSYAYNETPLAGNGEFPVSDINMSLGIRPGSEGLTIAAVVQTRGHQFRATLGGESGGIWVRARTGETWGQWRRAAATDSPGVIAPGHVTNFEFWHVDQSLQLWRDGTLIARHDYDWTPAERVEHTFGMSLDQAASGSDAMREAGNYTVPAAWFEFDGGPFTLHRVALSRDIHYQADAYRNYNDAGEPHSRAQLPALTTHPSSTLTLGPDQYFVCGDNSPQSLDGRLWDVPHPWVRRIDPSIGVVNRDLLIGKAFFVYFPAPYRVGRVPVPDTGRVRLIW